MGVQIRTRGGLRYDRGSWGDMWMEKRDMWMCGMCGFHVRGYDVEDGETIEDRENILEKISSLLLRKKIIKTSENTPSPTNNPNFSSI